MAFPKREAIVRITAVTALVVALGGAAGAVTGVLLTLIGTAVLPGRMITGPAEVFGVAAVLGALFGALLGTPIALVMLRNVPLWRATIETAAAAAAGLVVGRFIPMPFAFVAMSILFAILAAWRLRRAYAPKTPAATESAAR